MDIINLGIVAHVDAGKTTLTEHILYITGAIRKMGSVDSGDAHTDNMEIERRRGISVKSSCIKTVWRDTEINIIDTPGHMDFSAEIERALIALECAVLIVSAVEGVQSQTELIYKALKNLRIPTIFFINKTDRLGADVSQAVADIKDRLGARLCNYTDKEKVIESICENDDTLFELYINQGLSAFIGGKAEVSLREQFASCLLSPYISGSAVNSIGVEALLDLITEVCPRFQDHSGGELSGIIFKVEHDKSMGRLAHVKLYGGELKNRDVVRNHTLALDEKVVQIRKNQGVKVVDSGFLAAGDIGIISGLSQSRVGDILGCPDYVKQLYRMTAPLLKARVIPKDENDYPALVAAINELLVEDPLLNMTWVREKRELVINITGLIQIEILQDILLNRFNLHVSFEPPSVIYKETVIQTAEGYEAYTMPKPCWAILKFLIEPGERGSGVVYNSIVNVNQILPAYQSQVQQTLPTALRQGPLGWEVTDVKITLIDGEHHIMHTHPLDFVLATPLAIMNGLINAQTTLLEPMYRFRLSIPEDTRGKIMSELVSMRANLDASEIVKDHFYIEGRYPVAAGLNFPIRLASLTSGKGILSLEFGGYETCPLELGQTTPYIGVSPLDRAKYILHARQAL